jgi:L-glyceraldehyde 3-phosphate reductase
VDIFYHHRPDPATPLDETMSALDYAVKSGKAIYAGISNYSGAQTAQAVSTMKEHDWPRLLIHQVNYSMLRRQPEYDLYPVTQASGMGVICFCPLAQGVLTDKYLKGIPKDSRAASATGFLKPDRVNQTIDQVRQLNEIARQRGQSLAQMALAWVLRLPAVTSALIGASKPEQIVENVKALDKPNFTEDELKAIDAIVGVH